MKSALAPTLLLLGALTGCTIPRSAPVDAATGTERAEVIQTAQAMFDAMSTRDTATLRRLLMPEAMLFVADERQSPAVPSSRNIDSFLQMIATSTETLTERMYDPRVYIDGGVAILWARYTFHRNDRQSHCGHDGFHFVRADGQWRIASIIFTMRPKSACDAQK
jgi:hypothetical protein